ncbi:hypothetical protein VPH35_109531 [Triticum aestivum]
MFCPSRRLLHPQIPARPCNTRADSARRWFSTSPPSPRYRTPLGEARPASAAPGSLSCLKQRRRRGTQRARPVTDASVPLERRRWRIQRTRAMAAAAAVDAAGSACVGGGGSISFLE